MLFHRRGLLWLGSAVRYTSVGVLIVFCLGVIKFLCCLHLMYVFIFLVQFG